MKKDNKEWGFYKEVGNDWIGVEIEVYVRKGVEKNIRCSIWTKWTLLEVVYSKITELRIMFCTRSGKVIDE